ncbi:MAG TPA: hypothetical protein VNS34_07210 [Rhizobiaceae bacterium]|nr:hypothetical protein [Rhizobiaceae bacterium]
MARTVTLTDHEEIRDWAAARMGSPAIVDVSAEAGTQPMLRIVFDQAAYQDQDRPERPPNTGGVELVEWNEWFEIFDKNQLALVVAIDQPGTRENFHEIIRRDTPDLKE